MELRSCECGCDELIPIINKLGKPARFKHGHQARMPDIKGFAAKGKNHHSWKGGIRKHGDGYIYIWRPNHILATKAGYVLEHRLIYEEYHKCCLLSWSNIHHKNHVVTDNRIENLQGMTRAEHSRMHRLLENVT